jgi:hypothetical protein
MYVSLVSQAAEVAEISTVYWNSFRPQNTSAGLSSLLAQGRLDALTIILIGNFPWLEYEN